MPSRMITMMRRIERRMTRMSKKYKDPAKIMLRNVRISYAHIWEPRSMDDKEPKYSLSAIISKKDTELLEAMKKAIDAAIEAGKTKKWNGTVPQNLIMPLHDGDEERPDDEGYSGAMFVNARSSDAPQIVDRHVRPIEDPMDVYSGCCCNVTVTFFPYRGEKGDGIGVGLGNIQKVSDGDHLTGRASADSDFDPLDDADDEEELDNPFE